MPYFTRDENWQGLELEFFYGSAKELAGDENAATQSAKCIVWIDALIRILCSLDF